MVLEQFVVRIPADRQAAFEAAMEHALRTVMARADGLRGWSFRRSVENPDTYQVQIRWASVEAHMVGYREGPIPPQFRAIVMPFFAHPPDMQHFQELATS